MKKKMIDSQTLRDKMADKMVDDVPDRFQTAKEIQEQWELGEARTNALLKEGVKAGLLEVKKFRIKTGSILRNVSHYAEVEDNG